MIRASPSGDLWRGFAVLGPAADPGLPILPRDGGAACHFRISLLMFHTDVANPCQTLIIHFERKVVQDVVNPCQMFLIHVKDSKCALPFGVALGASLFAYSYGPDEMAGSGTSVHCSTSYACPEGHGDCLLLCAVRGSSSASQT